MPGCRRSSAGFNGRQVDRHIDIGHVVQGNDLAAGNSTSPGSARRYTQPLIGALMVGVVERDAQHIDARGGGGDYGIGGAGLTLRRVHPAASGGLQRALALIQLIVGGETLFSQLARAFQRDARQFLLALRAGEAGAAFYCNAARACSICASAARKGARRSSASSSATHPSWTLSPSLLYLGQPPGHLWRRHRLRLPPAGRCRICDSAAVPAPCVDLTGTMPRQQQDQQQDRTARNGEDMGTPDDRQTGAYYSHISFK